MSKPIFIQLIADYGTGDPAYAEVIQKILSLDREAKVMPVTVPKFSTVATGMWIEQLATVNAFPDLMIYSNTAPRIKSAKDGDVVKRNYGSFVFALLDNGVKVTAVHVGHSLSFIKNKIKKLHIVNVENDGSQFRSRDFYPEAVVGIAHGEKSFIGKSLPPSIIPEPPRDLVGFVDGYGNLKTTLRASQNSLSAGTKVTITCNGVTRKGLVVDKAYDVGDGSLSFAPGSTGGGDRYMEIWIKGDSAWETFGRPKVEQHFQVEPE